MRTHKRLQQDESHVGAVSSSALEDEVEDVVGPANNSTATRLLMKAGAALCFVGASALVLQLAPMLDLDANVPRHHESMPPDFPPPMPVASPLTPLFPLGLARWPIFIDNATVYNALKRASVINRSWRFNDTELFSYVHISKTGGSTFITWVNASRFFSRFYPRVSAGQEHGHLYDRVQRPHAQRLVFLRSPRGHVLSMFKECRYDDWGVRLIRSNLSTVPHAGTHQHDFEKWINFYIMRATGNNTGKNSMGCYDPWNFQARFMTSWSARPNWAALHEGYDPSIDAVLTSYLEMDWVGLTDFYDESLCLLLSRLQSRAAAATFKKSCNCQDTNRSALMNVPIERHGSVSSSAVDIYPELAAKMDRLTAVDSLLFSVALHGFFSDIKWLEARVGFRVMCPDTLRKAEPKLAYIANVTELYDMAI